MTPTYVDEELYLVDNYGAEISLLRFRCHFSFSPGYPASDDEPANHGELTLEKFEQLVPIGKTYKAVPLTLGSIHETLLNMWWERPTTQERLLTDMQEGE